MPKIKKQSFFQKITVGFLAILATIGSSIGVITARIIQWPIGTVVQSQTGNPSTSVPFKDILSNLSALASLLSLYYSYRADKRAIKEEEAEEAIKMGRREAQSEDSLESEKLYDDVIDERIKENIKSVITLQLSTFSTAIAQHPSWDGNDLKVKDKIARETHEIICGNLSLLKSYNNGKLPTKDKHLHNLWESFSCK